MSYESRGNHYLDTRIGYFNKAAHFTTIYVGNLNFDKNELDIQDIFAAYGVVSYVKLIKDRNTHESTGIAFIQMPDQKSAQFAIKKLNGEQVDGRTLKVSVAQESNESKEEVKPSKSKRRKPYKAYVSKKDRIKVATGVVSNLK